MDKKDNFKEFVKKNPLLMKYVKNNEMTWQKFYEMYDIYGEDENIWSDYIKKEEKKEPIENVGLSDVFSWFKKMDMVKVQENINSIQRVLGVLQDLGPTDKKPTKPEYKPRPLYKHFED